MKQSTIKEIFSPSDGKIYFVRDILERPQKELFEMRRKLRPRVGELAMLCSTCPGIQIISATLMDEWREVAN